MEINDLLKKAAEAGASDLHVKVGSPPVMRINGELVFMNMERITKEDSLRLAFASMSASQREIFKKEADLDFAYSVAGLGRFRCNAFLQRGAVGAVFRMIPVAIPGMDELNLPAVIKTIAREERGLVLVTGTTGCGKSTTLAAMIDLINSEKKINIVTIEDPIEYLHRDKKSLVNQREIGADTKGFSKALRAALRQDPDVILVGEMRDFETIQTALQAAETGHLVLSTLHTLDAAETVNRVIAFFPPYHQLQVRMQLSSVLRGVISLRLMPRADGRGRVPAVEVLTSTPSIRECILDAEKTKLLAEFIAKGKLHYGMQTFDQSLLDLYKGGVITLEEAMRHASNPDDFNLKIQGIRSTAEAFDEKNRGGAGDMGIERFSR